VDVPDDKGEYIMRIFLWSGMETLLPYKETIDLFSAPPQDKFDLYLYIGNSNTGSRAPILEGDDGTVERTLLLNAQDLWEPASFAPLPDKTQIQGYNRYSSTEKASAFNGYSAGYTFAQDLVKEIPGRTIGIISNARGTVTGETWFKGDPSGRFDEAVRRTKEAQKSGVLKGIIISSPSDDTPGIVADLRAELGVTPEECPVIIQITVPLAQYASQRTAALNAAAVIPNSGYMENYGVSDIGDDTHLDRTAQQIYGIRAAEKVLELVYGIQKKLPEPVAGQKEAPPAEYKLKVGDLYMVPKGADPQMIGGQLMAPYRYVFEPLGVSAVWDGAAQTVTAVKGGDTVVLTVGSLSAAVNDGPVSLAAAPAIVDGEVMVPAEFSAAAFGRPYSYDDGTKTASIQ
jgi:hypothetical protein